MRRQIERVVYEAGRVDWLVAVTWTAVLVLSVASWWLIASAVR